MFSKKYVEKNKALLGMPWALESCYKEIERLQIKVKDLEAQLRDKDQVHAVELEKMRDKQEEVSAENKRLISSSESHGDLFAETLSSLWGLFFMFAPGSWQSRIQVVEQIRSELDERARRLTNLENMRRIDAESHKKALESLQQRIAEAICEDCRKGIYKAGDRLHMNVEQVWGCAAFWVWAVPLVEEVPDVRPDK